MASNARIDELRKKFEENPKRYFAPLANEYRKAGEPEEAIAICEMYLHQQPGHMSGHIVYGQALFEANRLDKAREVFESALALDQENLIALKHLGDIARMNGDIYGARAWYLRILEADPRNEEIQGYIADLEKGAQGSRETETENQESKSGESFDSSFPPPDNPASIPEFVPSFQPAVETAEIPDMLPPPPPPPQFVTETMAELYIQQGHTDEAIEVYMQLAEQNPNDESFRRKIRELRGEPEPVVSAVPSQTDETIREFFARIGAFKPSPGSDLSSPVSPLDQLFGSAQVPSPEDSDAASQLAQAFADMNDPNYQN